MTSEEMDEIEARVLKFLEREHLVYFNGMPPEDHVDDHQFMRLQKREMETRIARNEEIRRHVAKWSIVAILSLGFTAIYHHFFKK